MPSVTLTDPVAHTLADAGLIATNNANLRATLNGALDGANFKTAGIVAGEGWFYNGSSWTDGKVATVSLTNVVSGVTDITYPGGVAVDTYIKISTGGGSVRRISAPTYSGQRITILNGTSSNTTVTHNAGAGTGLVLLNRTGADVVLAQNDSITYVYDGTSFIEVSKSISSAYDRVTTNVDVQNTTTETTFYTKTITANDLGTNRMIRTSINGDYLHNNVAGDTMVIKIKFGGTTFWANAAVALGGTATANRHPWTIKFDIMEDGATNAQELSGFWAFEPTAGAAPTTGIGGVATVGQIFPLASTSGAMTVDTTANQDVAVTATWSAASANNSWRMRHAITEIVY